MTAQIKKLISVASTLVAFTSLHYITCLKYFFLIFAFGILVQTHYLKNREERGTARVDVKAAKNAYLEEVKQAGLLREYEYQRL